MQLVLDTFAFKVTHHGDEGCVLMLHPLAAVDDGGGLMPTGIPIMASFSDEKRDALIAQLEAGRTNIKRADKTDLEKATKGLAVPPTQRGRSG